MNNGSHNCVMRVILSYEAKGTYHPSKKFLASLSLLFWRAHNLTLFSLNFCPATAGSSFSKKKKSSDKSIVDLHYLLSTKREATRVKYFRHESVEKTMTLKANDARSAGCVNRQQRAVTTSPGNKATLCLQVVPLPKSAKKKIIISALI